MRILVTGGTGTLGRALVPRLARSHEVHVLARRPSPPGLELEAEWIEQDLTRPLNLAALPNRIDGVVHLAQSDRFRDFPAGAEDVFEVNVHSTFRLLEYARSAGAAKFVLASTGGVYGYSPTPIAESASLRIPGPYFRSKRIAELLLDDYSELLAGVVLRFFFVYGPGQGRTLVPRLAGRILAGEEIVIDGDPGIRINPVHVGDAAAAIEAALGLEASAMMNVAGPETVTITELTDRLAELLGKPALTRHVGEGPEGDMVAETARMEHLLGFRAETPLADGLRDATGSLLGTDSRPVARERGAERLETPHEL